MGMGGMCLGEEENKENLKKREKRGAGWNWDWGLFVSQRWNGGSP